MFLRNKSTIIFIALALIVIAGGAWYAQKPAPKTPPVVSDNGEQAVNKTGDELAGGEIDTSDWKTYRNEKYGFEFQYPKNWNLDDIQKNNEIISVSNYFTNKFGDQNGSKIWIVIEENKYNSFAEWTKQNFNVFENETIEKNTNFDFKGLKANLVKSTNPIAGGYNNRLAVFYQQKNLIYAIWSYRGIRTELKNENEVYEKVIDRVVDSFKIVNN